MKILNRILSVLVLVAALGAAVVAFLLFQKREQMLLGWEQMANTVSQTASALDAKSAAGLKPEKLSHKLPIDELQKNLSILSAAAKRVNEKRDGLAETLKKVADISEVSSIDLAALKSLDQTEAVQQAAVAGVRKTHDRNEKIMKSYIEVGSFLGVTGTSLNSLKRDGDAEFKGRIRQEVDNRKNRIGFYQDGYKRIATHVEVSSLDFGETGYKASVNKVASAVQQQKSDCSKAKRDLAACEGKLTSAQSELKSKAKQISGFKTKIDEQEKHIALLKNKLNPTKNGIIEDYVYDRTPERSLYAEIRGTVRKVDRKWGIVVVDIGRKHDVRRLIDGKELSNIVNFPMGRIMTVVRGDKTDKSKVIGKIKIVDVHDSYSIGNIDTKSLNGADVMEGDTVLFSDSDLDKFAAKQKTVASH